MRFKKCLQKDAIFWCYSGSYVFVKENTISRPVNAREARIEILMEHETNS